MLKRFALALLLMLFAFNARATNYTDVYYDILEPGWGAFLIQSDTFQFIAFFIYGQDGKPIWYTAQLTDDGTGNYTGTLYAITGTYYANPWQGYTINPAGTASFTPSDLYHATLTYTVNGVGTITKAMQRQTLTAEKMSANYSGSMAGSISGCTNPAADDPMFRGRYGLAVTQNADTSISLMFTFVDAAHAGIVCTAAGPINHFGRLYQVAGGTLTCTGPGQDGMPRPLTIEALHPTGQGIEGVITGIGGGCAATLHFAAVFPFND